MRNYFSINKFRNILQNKLLSVSVIYTIINFANKAFPFLLLPLLTRALSTQEYGEYSLFRATTSILLPFIGFNLSEYVMKNYFSKDEHSLAEKISLSLLINFVLFTGFILIVSIIGNDTIMNVIHMQKEFLIASIIVTLCTSINNIERNILRCQNKIRIYSILVIGQTVLFFLSVLLLLFLEKIDLHTIIYIEVITFVIFGIISLVFLRRNYKIRLYYNKTLVILIISFCLPLVVNSLFAYIFSLSDRFVIANQLDTHSVGVYNATFQLVSVLQILAVSFNTAWTPFVYSKLENNIEKGKLRKIQFYVITAFIVICIIFYIIMMQVFGLIVGSNYSSGSSLIKWLIVGNLFQLIYWLNSTVLIYNKKNWSLASFSFVVTAMSLILNLLFIKKFGLQFAAIVFCFSWIVLAIFTFIKSETIMNSIKNKI